MKQETKSEFANFLDGFSDLAALIVLALGFYYSTNESNFLGIFGFVIATVFYFLWKFKGVKKKRNILK